jgi:hypothetical protein
MAIKDTRGAVIGIGDAVRQCSDLGTPWYDPNKGAILTNAGQTGTVTGLGRTRVRVDFGRTRRDVYGSVESTEYVTDNVAASMLTLVDDDTKED